MNIAAVMLFLYIVAWIIGSGVSFLFLTSSYVIWTTKGATYNWAKTLLMLFLIILSFGFVVSQCGV